MQNETRVLFNAYLDQVAELSGVASALQKFAVAPSVQQKLENKVQESSGFLQKINIIGVTQQQGEKLGLGVGNPVASTTNTAATARTTTDVSVLDSQGYVCTQTNSDTHIRYELLDAWAKYQDFQIRVRDAIMKRQALDRIMIGFNGTSRAATSNKAANPLLQDVNKGWLQKIREAAPERRLNNIDIGAAQEYKNVDALVYDMVNSLIDPWYREDSGLVVVLGRDLMADKYFPLVNSNQAPSEQLATDVVISQKRVGGLPAATVPYFPANALMITRLDNLSLYYQDGARRRTVVDNASRDRIENFESSNDAYVVEDFGMTALAENLTLA
ncbi:phage major capsid protein, P2 family [Methylobacillus glycogenes]|uniref:phage major capsid protein, P2 family n=1 Tax=Methylobacillus glycogenes TaxID=406 RepID=UPI00047173EE|nr:phage major capsid protein, P2 family [Methylobacillus glycogenes]